MTDCLHPGAQTGLSLIINFFVVVDWSSASSTVESVHTTTLTIFMPTQSDIQLKMKQKNNSTVIYSLMYCVYRCRWQIIKLSIKG